MIEEALTLGDEVLITGILTQPTTLGDASKPMILLTNAGLLHRVGPHRQWVDLARLLSEDGWSVFRFDITGLGDSEMREDQLTDEIRPVYDFVEVMNYLQQTYGAKSFVIIGLCSGADHAHNVALFDKRVVGTVFLDAKAYRTWGWHMHYYLSRIIEYKKWTRRLRSLYKKITGGSKELPAGNDNPLIRNIPSRDQTQAELTQLVNRKVGMLFIYTSGVDSSINYAHQFRDMYPKLDSKHLIQVEYYPWSDHTFTLMVHRKWLQNTIRDWLQRYH